MIKHASCTLEIINTSKLYLNYEIYTYINNISITALFSLVNNEQIFIIQSITNRVLCTERMAVYRPVVNFITKDLQLQLTHINKLLISMHEMSTILKFTTKW